MLALLALSGLAAADVYMHNPRGSNDRNCERNENRNNGNRLFDSQNNDKGGYACPRAVGGPDVITPRMYYYSGSKLRIEWTNQHGCGDNENTHCDIVMQYMCEDANPLIRDGTPSDQNDAATDRMETESQITDPRYGYHETYDYYMKCAARSRNMGLWISDQRVGPNARNTRQNPNANRRGWECPEERDYYPYWHDSPWKDIAVLTSDTSRCDRIKDHSQNVEAKYECLDSEGKAMFANTEALCARDAGIWTKFPSHGLSAPDCEEAPWTRDNHLGNTADGYMDHYIWTLPSVQCESAVFRLRYNMTNANAEENIDWTMNGPMGLEQDPYVDTGIGYNLSFAVNTDQYGRTFQDRSYVFSIKERPSGVPKGDIWNLNVRGKRGNIVQTYPAVEYDFVPQVLKVTNGQYIHFQWVGSDYNPNRQPNNAEGGPVDPANANTYRADRNNIMQLESAAAGIPAPKSKVTMFDSKEIIEKMAMIDQTDCLSYEELVRKNSINGQLNKDQLEFDSQNCMKLNAAKTPYFDGGLVKMKNDGTFHYFSSRNNNFTNRSQKATIVVEPMFTKAEIGGIAFGATVGAAGVATAGSFAYAKTNPSSSINSFMKNKLHFPGL